MRVPDDAKKIAYRDLLACNTPIGLTAGAHHFVDLWARDSLFATFGLSDKKDFPVMKKTIETFLAYQREDGLIPYRVRRSAVSIGKYFGQPSVLQTPQADFRSYQSGGLVPDGGLMTVIAAAAYVRKSGDRKFRLAYDGRIHRVLKWYGDHYNDGLITEWFQCEWADGVLKSGNTLYTNILYWKALGDMKLFGRQKHIGDLIRKAFWNGNFFADWVDWKRQDYFAAHPNMLAIIFGLATHEESADILNFAKEHCWNGWALEENYPAYPWWRIPLLHTLAGMGDYHNRGCIWLQPTILYAVALRRLGETNESKKVLAQVAKKIVEYHGVYEIYEKNGMPVRRLFYHSEQPFAWSAGLYLWAASLLQ